VKRNVFVFIGVAALAIAGFAAAQSKQSKKGRTSPVGYSDTPVLPGQKWKVHDISRPRPPAVTPAPAGAPVPPPSDAVVLFDGKDLSKWRGPGAKAAGWKVENGYVEVVGGAGDLVTREKFGSGQYHLEWASPNPPDGSSQWRGNSGVLLMGRYEIQVLDSFNAPTYADGQAGAIYGQWPPLVNASRKPGEWQTYDIAFEAPRFEAGKLAKPGYVTVFHNGVMIHHHQEIIGQMAHRIVRAYEPHEAEEPFSLQDHDTLVRYRNIWIRRARAYDQP
jgi:hypothetical protein